MQHDASEPFRAYMPSVPGWVEPVTYLTFGLTVLIVVGDATLRLRRYGVGWRGFLGALFRTVRERPGEVLAALAREALGQRRVRRDRRAGHLHDLIFGAFLVLTIGTALISLEEHLTSRVGVHFLRGGFYLAYEVTLETAGILLVVGVLMAVWRRYRRPPPYLGPRRSISLVYGLLLYAALSGFLLEALRLLVHPVSWGGYSYVGWALSRIMSPLVGERPLALYWGVWGAHFVGVFATMAIVLRTALDHALVLPLNMALQAGRDPARLSLPFNLATVADEASLEEVRAGVGDARELDWPLRLSLDACVSCGRCDRVCPALAAGRPLSPQDLVQALGEQIRALPKAPGPDDGDLFARGVLEEATVWSCLVCGACARECPAWIDQPGTIVDLRRHLVGEGRLDERQAALAGNIERNGNPFGLPSFQRGEWLASLGAPTIRERPDAEYLYWIGCMASYDPSAQRIAEAMIRLLAHAGLSFAVLGEEERCTGESARKMGDEAGFQLRAMENIAMLQDLGVRRILTHCPHCFITFTKDYPAFGGDFEVLHHSELLARLIREGRIPKPAAPTEGRVAYHDPCNLGRLAGCYEAPREVARFAAGAALVEPEQSRDRTFCCGAGGGSSWWVVPEETKVSHVRLQQLRATGASTVATACPFCLGMLEDASRVAGDEVVVADLAELIAVSLPGPAATRTPGVP